MILCEESLAKFDKNLLENIAKSLTNRDIELVLVDSAKMREINKAQRQIDKSTDVLSFPLINPLQNSAFEANLSDNLSQIHAKSDLKLSENPNDISAQIYENSHNLNIQQSPEFLLLGSIVINLDAVNSGAREFKHSENAEFALLFLHGLLHLLGFDHEKDSGEMREKESEIIAKFKLPKSLIVRNL